MTSTNKRGKAFSRMGEASDAVAHILELILKRIFSNVPFTIRMDLGVPKIHNRISVLFPKLSHGSNTPIKYRLTSWVKKTYNLQAKRSISKGKAGACRRDQQSR